MNIRRVIYFRARGSKLMRFVNAVRESAVICVGQRLRNEEYTGQIFLYDLEHLKSLAKEFGIELFLDAKSGQMFKVLKYRMRYGILLGFIFFVFFSFYFSNTVVKIEVSGNNRLSTSQVLSVLEETGIRKGVFIPSLDLGKCEQDLKLMLNNTGWAGVRKQGGRIIVDIHEIDDTPTTVKKNMPCNIVAGRDAVIMSIEAAAGQKILKPGDSVTKGEVIISGIVNNTMYDSVVLHSIGNVRGLYTDEHTFVQYFVNNEKKFTDQKIRRYLDFFGLRFPLFIGNACSVPADYSEYTSYFSFFGAELPLGTVNCTYDIYQMKDIVYTSDEAAELIKQKIQRYEKNFYSGCVIKNVKKDKKEYDDRIEVRVRYTLEGDIGVEKEIFMK
ncbi:MAG: sporulation protein YqfD [Oscillospiraceae bacterium]|nr:sporulation protein YqfD [Oscillospiraceae bacterium]